VTIRTSIWTVAPVVGLAFCPLVCAQTIGAVRPLPTAMEPGELPISSVEMRVMPMVDTAALEAEDLVRESSGRPFAPRFALNIQVTYTLDNSGTWETLNDGSRRWRLRIVSPGALSLNLGLNLFELPVGAEFWIFAPNSSGAQGPYTKTNQNVAGGLWTAVVIGEEIVVELRVPKGAEARIEINSVNHGYRFFGEREALIPAKRGDCNVNVVCPEGDPWRDQIRSVAGISISGMYLCTAQLVNNTAEDFTPYLLTAQHCVEQSSDAPTVVAYWNFQSPTCSDAAGGNLSQNQSGSTFVSSSEYATGSDFTLLELDDQPQPSFNVYYSGWDARDQLPSSTTVIHHPSGDEKSISFDDDPPTVTSLGGSASPGNGRYLRVADWDLGTTEGGSSGSCLFDSASKRCVATLSGGFAACGNDEPDWFGWVHAHWIGHGTSATRLSDWLDSGGTGSLTWRGTDAGPIFADGFETGNTWAWARTVP